LILFINHSHFRFQHLEPYAFTGTGEWRGTTLAVAYGGTGIVTATRFVSNVAQGTAPISVGSSTLVTNLNADFVDGLNANNITSQIDRARTFAYFMGAS